MIISLTENSVSYAKVVFDIIRIFLPRISWQQLTDNTNLENIYKLHIGVSGDYINTQLFFKDELLYHNQEKIVKRNNNNVKRTIKLSVYKVLLNALETHGSPWGILTGIRPTKIVHRLWDQGLSQGEIEQCLRNNYLVDSKKINDLIEITKIQRPFLAKQNQHSFNKISIYISIPFCPTRCHYCSFPAFSLGQWSKEVTSYIKCLIQEVEAIGQALKDMDIMVETIYIGGGTPTSLSAQQLATLMDIVNKFLRTRDTLEVTVEAGRPDTITTDKLKVLKASNVNRISINPQTMWLPTLESIGRSHTPDDIVKTVDLARKIGFNNINMDLILGLPGETKEHFKYTLDKIKDLRPENITFHALAVKRGSKLRDDELVFSNDISLQMNELKEEWCSQQGYIPYYLYRQKQITGNLENVGYSLSDMPCIYNIQMMEERQTIWGLGVGACSKIINPIDWTLDSLYNPKDILIYNERIKEIIKTKVDKICGLS